MSINDYKTLLDVRAKFSIITKVFYTDLAYTDLKLTLQKLDKVIERIEPTEQSTK